MDTLLISIGQLSEEVLEARHKEFRSFRQYRTRKIPAQDKWISTACLIAREVVEMLKIPEQK